MTPSVQRKIEFGLGSISGEPYNVLSIVLVLMSAESEMRMIRRRCFLNNRVVFCTLSLSVGL